MAVLVTTKAIRAGRSVSTAPLPRLSSLSPYRVYVQQRHKMVAAMIERRTVVDSPAQQDAFPPNRECCLGEPRSWMTKAIYGTLENRSLERTIKLGPINQQKVGSLDHICLLFHFDCFHLKCESNDLQNDKIVNVDA
ncbi:hypothetical protein DdX_01175 [Ditylenchus destructor]|uniref:Uncharacterized protein n=1 Tax=Ditylenchus destructor TaxID=166010 RepID=A0AAD4RDI8_9BILA|nr:hypothetical protein DdX_01175 [Ditylenchus destructor]